MNIIDYIIIGVLLLSALVGFKKGIINSIVTFVGTIIVIILAFYLKNPISNLFYDYIPFLNLFGKFSGVQTFNILVIEGLSYAVTLAIISTILGVIAKVTGVLGRLLNSGLILGIPSRIGGLICGVLEGVVVSFIIVFLLSTISSTSELVNKSSYADTLLTKTPILSSYIKDTYNGVNEVYTICINYEKEKDKTEANAESLRVLLKYNIITPKSAEKLVNNKKLTFTGASDIINDYRKETQNDWISKWSRIKRCFNKRLNYRWLFCKLVWSLQNAWYGAYRIRRH